MQLERYFEVSECRDLASFEATLLRMAADLGFQFINAVVVSEGPLRSKPHVAVIGNTPQTLLDATSNPELMARDPVASRLKQTSLPFTYDQDFYVKGGAAELWEEQASFGFKEGIAVALHLPDHRHFLLGVDGPDRLPARSEDLCRLMADLQFFAVHAQTAALRLMAEPTQHPIEFSAREIEILQWAMAGKSAQVTASLLGITHHGVNYHLGNLFRKLGVASKSQALIKAVELGLIQAR